MIELVLLAALVALLAGAHAIGGLPLTIATAVALSVVLHRAAVRMRGRS